jgi:uncharacterized protein
MGDNSTSEMDVRQVRSRSVGSWLLLFLVRFYITFLSPFFGGSCKFYPSCSNYAFEAIARHGAWRGFVLASKRLLRCRPFTKGGFDPVPDPDSTRIASPVSAGVSASGSDLPVLGCLGKPFEAALGSRHLRSRSKEGAAQ